MDAVGYGAMKDAMGLLEHGHSVDPDPTSDEPATVPVVPDDLGEEADPEGEEAEEEEGPGAGGGDCWEANPWRRLGVIEKSPNTFVSIEGGIPLGRINLKTIGGTKATCARHPKCLCWISASIDEDVAVHGFVEWLSMKVSAAEHTSLGRELKRSHGMKVRG